MKTNNLTLKDVNKGSPNMFVRDVEPFFQYENGKKTDKIGGTTYTGTLWFQHTEVRVKVYDELQAKISVQMLENSPNGMIEAIITGFTGKLSANQYKGGAIELTGTATAVNPVQVSAPTPQATKS